MALHPKDLGALPYFNDPIDIACIIKIEFNLRKFIICIIDITLAAKHNCQSLVFLPNKDFFFTGKMYFKKMILFFNLK